MSDSEDCMNFGGIFHSFLQFSQVYHSGMQYYMMTPKLGMTEN